MMNCNTINVTAGCILVSEYRKPDLSDPDKLIEEYEPFIRRTASFALHKIVSRHDDAYSVALSAFWEAANNYDPERGGSLKTYAKMVINSRLTDYLRHGKKYDAESLTDPALFTGNGTEDDKPLQKKIEAASSMVSVTPLAEEIGDLENALGKYGIKFEVLPEISPKAEKTREVCAHIVSYFSKRPDLVAQMIRTGKLPVSDLERDVPCDRKILDRYRKYIITAALIKTGDYPGLQSYLHGKGWE